MLVVDQWERGLGTALTFDVLDMGGGQWHLRMYQVWSTPYNE